MGQPTSSPEQEKLLKEQREQLSQQKAEEEQQRRDLFERRLAILRRGRGGSFAPSRRSLFQTLRSPEGGTLGDTLGG